VATGVWRSRLTLPDSAPVHTSNRPADGADHTVVGTAVPFRRNVVRLRYGSDASSANTSRVFGVGLPSG
jgi:hypothetical protein